MPSASELAEAIRNGDASSAAVVDAHLERIEAHDDPLNAVVTRADERARRRAEEADAAISRGEIWGPLHGVPVTVKDTYETKGLRTTASYEALSDYVPDEDATVVARLREAGAIVLGKTNLPLLATDLQTDSPVFGRTNNPWDPERTPGGSSGGSGVAVAAEFAPLGLGSDLGGSVRVPAHFCGVYGLKPTEHRVPATGHVPDWHVPGVSGATRPVRHQGTYGPLARSVADLELCLSLIEGPDGRDATVPPVPDEDVPDRPLSEYRFAWCTAFGELSASAGTEDAIAQVTTDLDDLGCTVEEGAPPEFEFETAWRTWGEIVAAELAGGLSLKLRALFWVLFATSGRPPMDRGITRGLRSRRRTYQAALSRRDELVARMDAFLAERDALLCPVTPTPAFTHRRTGTSIGVDGTDVPYMMGVAGFTSVFNVTGHPVVVVPVGRSSEGLPIGMQVVGSRWEDRGLLEVARALTAVTDGYERPPME